MNDEKLAKKAFSSFLLEQGGEEKTEKQKLLQRQKCLNIKAQGIFLEITNIQLSSYKNRSIRLILICYMILLAFHYNNKI